MKDTTPLKTPEHYVYVNESKIVEKIHFMFLTCFCTGILLYVKTADMLVTCRPGAIFIKHLREKLMLRENKLALNYNKTREHFNFF